MDISIFGEHDEKTIEQINNCTKHEAVVKAALLPDGHLGYGVPIGGVIAYDSYISPTGVGFDIACGNKIVKTDVNIKNINQSQLSKIMDDIWDNIAFGIGKNNESKDAPRDVSLFDNELWKLPHLNKLKEKARNQLGTVGSGNHYVDLLTDDEGWIYVGVHFGSRGLGHGIATHYLKLCGAKDGMMVDPLVIPTYEDIGREYIESMWLAGSYAYAGRNWVCNKVLSIMGAVGVDSVHNHHNYAWLEEVDGDFLWVVRKGATPITGTLKGFVGGSMGDVSVILKGKDTGQANDTIHSAVHGSGRVMSRSKARGKINWKTGEIKKPGVVTPELMQEKMDEFNPLLELRGGGLDESPQCYRKLKNVLAYIDNAIEVETWLRPVGVAMASLER